MEQLLETLHKIGFSECECEHVRMYFDGDIKGLRFYVLYSVALLDDSHEYI